MATIVEKTIGTGGDYATPALWIADCPANLVTSDIIWRGLVLPQEFVNTTTPVVEILTAGKTVDASHYVELTTAPGASFVDHADRATNPLRYDASKGAAFKVTGNYTIAINVTLPYTRVSKLQFASTSTLSGAAGAGTFSVLSGTTDANQCIFESSAETLQTLLLSAGSVARNCTVVQLRASTAPFIAALVDTAKAYNCTFVSLGATLAKGIKTQYGSATMKNCYVGGVTIPEDGTTAITKTNCYSSVAATGYSVVALSTSTFENVTSGTHDLRLKSGSGLIDVGATDATNAANDIIGTARPQGSAYDVGAWEYASGGAPDTTPPTLSSPTGTKTGTTTASGSVTTDEANGTMYAIVSASATKPTPTQIQAGQSATGGAAAYATSKAVTATGVQAFSATGLAPATTYYWHYQHKDAAGNDSTVATSPSFTTDAATVQKWRVPTNAPQGTAVHVTILSGSSPTYSIAAQGAATVDASGNADLAGSGTTGAKSFAFVHNYSGSTSTTSIYGGPAIATLTEV